MDAADVVTPYVVLDPVAVLVSVNVLPLAVAVTGEPDPERPLARADASALPVLELPYDTDAVKFPDGPPTVTETLPVS